MAEHSAKLLQNIEIMNRLEGFDVVVVCCGNDNQAKYWQIRLENGKGSVLSSNALVLCVEEDWPGGAGNALGTLYAFVKAARLAKELHNIDLLGDLKSGRISVGLYHTAGKGTRLAPLPGAENNNKPGVKLAATVLIGGNPAPITILEGVIKQTGCYAKSRKGRLSVFWGDQVFIPTASVDYTVTHHVDILCSLGPMMTEDEWKSKGMDKYGLIAQCEGGKAAQVEKVSHATAVQLLSGLGEIQSVGASLGSFSVSWQMLDSLLNEFSAELSAKKGKLDSDPHLWMPMTLSKDSYLHLMKSKGMNEQQSAAHFDRIQSLLAKFDADHGAAGLGHFGPVDVGQGVYWWDYGQLKLFLKNTLMMTDSSSEAEMMRLFLGITNNSFVKDSTVSNTVVDSSSIVSSCELGSSGGAQGFVRKSVLSNVRCKYIEAEDCVLINVTAEKIIAKPGSIIYNVLDNGSIPSLVVDGSLSLKEKEVATGVFNSAGDQLLIQSNTDIDGGKAWETQVAGNAFSFEEVHNRNADACPTTLEKSIAEAHDNVWARINA